MIILQRWLDSSIFFVILIAYYCTMWYLSTSEHFQVCNTCTTFFSAAFFAHSMAGCILNLCLHHFFSFGSVTLKMYFISSLNGNSFYFSFIYFLCLNLSLPYSPMQGPKRFWWHIKDGYKSRSIKLSIFKRFSNFHHPWQKSMKNVCIHCDSSFINEDMNAQGNDAFCKESVQLFLNYIYKWIESMGLSGWAFSFNHLTIYDMYIIYFI